MISKAIAVMSWKNDKMDYTLENMVRADMVGQILTMLYTEKIREEASAAYSVAAQSALSRDDYRSTATVYVYCPMKPEKGDVAVKIMDEEVRNLCNTVDAEKLKKVKEYMLKNNDDRAKTNNYWVGVIRTLRQFGIDSYTDFKQTVEAQTPETIAAFMKQLLKSGDRAEVIMLPEE